MNDQSIIKVVFPVAFTAVSLFLLIAGLACYYNNDFSVIKQGECQGVYISGLFMTFIVCLVIGFALLTKIVDSFSALVGQRRLTSS